jgi:ketosteroid isomerase-like protein
MAAPLPAPLGDFLDAWNAWDVERMLPLLHPDVEIRGLRAALENTSYSGRVGARRFFRDFEESWTDTRGELRGHETFDHHVAVTLLLRLRARETRVEFKRNVGLLFELEAGLIRAWLTYLDPSEAYEGAAARAARA